jgi:hypothetical protein
MKTLNLDRAAMQSNRQTRASADTVAQLRSLRSMWPVLACLTVLLSTAGSAFPQVIGTYSVQRITATPAVAGAWAPYNPTGWWSRTVTFRATGIVATTTTQYKDGWDKAEGVVSAKQISRRANFS